mmetsp:Transcript_101439/g.272537  ORF Transcript_101439/g.272537 Transcript_101439/m.272537 type:complete len:115 (-) Transcript_101439:477-821(-)
MDFFSCSSACGPRDPATDTVKFDAAAIGAAALAFVVVNQDQHQRAQHDQQEEAECAAEDRHREVQQQRLLEQEHEEQRRREEVAKQERYRQESEARMRREQERGGGSLPAAGPA